MPDYTEEERHELRGLQDSYSDYHKDVFGYRPREPITDEEWHSLAFLRILHAELDAEFHRRCETPLSRAAMRDQGWGIEEPNPLEIAQRALILEPGSDLEAFRAYLAQLNRFHDGMPIVTCLTSEPSGPHETLLSFQGTGPQLDCALAMAGQLREALWLSHDTRYADPHRPEGRAVLRYQGQTIAEPEQGERYLSVVIPSAHADLFTRELQTLGIEALLSRFPAFPEHETTMLHFPGLPQEDHDTVTMLALRHYPRNGSTPYQDPGHE